MIIYDITNRQTFEDIKLWISEIKEEITDKVNIFIVGNKIDMERCRIVSKKKEKNWLKN